MAEVERNGRLFEWYSTYIGEPDRHTDVYLGFALFFGAILLGLGALVAVAAGQWLGAGNFLSREVGFVLGMVAIPAILLSLIVLLPVDERALYSGLLGSVVCVGGIAFFSYAYPNQWAVGPGPRYSVLVLVVYGVGLTALLASTFGALVAYHVDRLRPGPADIDPIEDEDGKEFTDEEIREDIDKAMDQVDLTWGGVKRAEGTSLKLTTNTADIDTSGMDVNVDRVTRTSVDDQVSGLKSIKGGQKQTARSETTVDDQTAQLNELKQRKRDDSKTESTGTWLGRVLARVGNLR